jgi:hypothetical protein
MKLRIHGDCLRFRLGPGDVQQLTQRGGVTAKISFGGLSELAYSLVVSEAAAAIRASFESGVIRVEIPMRVAIGWAGGDEVGMEARQTVGAGRTLNILVEKDFECLDAAGNEPGEKRYPNPLKSTS